MTEEKNRIKERNRNQGYFLFGVIFGIALMVAYISILAPFTQPLKSDSYNHYAGDWECNQNCQRFNSTAIHSYSYADDRWHCYCESEGDVVKLW